MENGSKDLALDAAQRMLLEKDKVIFELRKSVAGLQGTLEGVANLLDSDGGRPTTVAYIREMLKRTEIK